MKYSGVGNPPPAVPLADVGHCTQIATFTKVIGACTRYLVPLCGKPYDSVSRLFIHTNGRMKMSNNNIRYSTANISTTKIHFPLLLLSTMKHGLC